MHRYIKILPLIALFAFGAVLLSWPTGAKATPIGAPNWTGPNASGLYTITASYSDDTPVGSSSAVLTAIGAGQFITGSASVIPMSDEAITVSANTVTVSEDSDTVAQVKTITVSFQCTATGTVSFTLTHGGTASTTSTVMTCSFNGSYTGYPPYTGYPGSGGGYGYPGTFNPLAPIYSASVATQLGVSASPASLNCGSASSISVVVRDANGNPVPDGTSVSLSASMGTLAPATGVTTGGGYMTSTFTSASSDGAATITASSGGASGTATVSVSCAGSTAGIPSYSPPPVYAPPPSTIILPPNTGDAGLVGTHRASAALPAAIATALVVLVGGGLLAGWSYRRENQAR
jgi:hypothetical protein